MAKKPSAPNKAFVRKDPDAWKRYGWTSIPNSIVQAPDIPPEEGWAWGWMASHTETFEISAEKLWHANEHVSKHKAYALMHNLEERGLLLRTHEATSDGVPYIVYDLQPWPVPPEQRTHKPRKPKPKKPFPQERTKTTNTQAETDSRPSGNPGMTRNNARRGAVSGEDHGFPTVRESGNDQEQRADPDKQSEQRVGGVSPDRVSPDRSGESYKEEKTNGKDQPTKGTIDEPSGAVVGPSSNAGWLDDQPDEDGIRILRSLPRGVGDALTSTAVSEWSHVIGAALQSGMSEQVITDKLTSELPDDDRAKRVRFVVGRRLPELKATIAEPVQYQQPSPSEAAHAKVDRMASRGEHGAREAAGKLGEFWDPEQHRGDVGTRDWKLEILPQLSREFVEQRREALVQVLTSRNAA